MQSLESAGQAGFAEPLSSDFFFPAYYFLAAEMGLHAQPAAMAQSLPPAGFPPAAQFNAFNGVATTQFEHVHDILSHPPPPPSQNAIEWLMLQQPTQPELTH